MKTSLFVVLIAGLCANAFAASAPQISDKEAAKFATYAPQPEYPIEARRAKITGNGVVRVDMNTAGIVTSAKMEQVTGSPILDNAATSCFKRWRFKPGRTFWFRTPVMFFMPGPARSGNGWVL